MLLELFSDIGSRPVAWGNFQVGEMVYLYPSRFYYGPDSIRRFPSICSRYFVGINFFLILEAPTAKTPALNAFAAEQNEDHTEGEAWGVDGDLLLDEEGNPEMDEIEMIGGEEDEEGGWDVS